MSKFKVGDKVRIIKSDFTFDSVGDVMTVSRVFSNGFAVSTNTHPNKHKMGNLTQWRAEWSYYDNQAELVEEPTEPITPTDESKEDIVNHPNHYTHGMECIDEMVMIFGEAAVKSFCKCNAWKYRKRALHKNGQEDLDKADWYIAKYKELEDLEKTKYPF